MGFFSKKESVPQLPPAPRLPELPNPYEKRDLPELPSFPLNKNNDNLNREMIKSAVSEGSIITEEDVTPRTREMDEAIPMLPRRMVEEKSFTLTNEERDNVRAKLFEKDFPRRRVLELNADIENKPVTKQMEPIYVRIDRFQTSKKNFEKIKEKVTEVEKVLRKIKEVKEREESELEDWSMEIEKLKTRLSEIDSDVFSQL